MPRFITELIYQDNNGQTWTLWRTLEYQTDLTKPAATITVPEKFVTDLASIPAFAQNLISKVGPWDKPAVIHDWLYTTGQFERALADRILLEAMAATGTGWIRRRLIYAAVRMGGWKAWNDHRKEDSKKDPIWPRA